MVVNSRVLHGIHLCVHILCSICLTLAVADMLEGVKGGDRLGAPPRLSRFNTTNLQTQQPIGVGATIIMMPDCYELRPSLQRQQAP